METKTICIAEGRTTTQEALERLGRRAYWRYFHEGYWWYITRCTGSYERWLTERALNALDLVEQHIGKEAMNRVFEKSKAHFIETHSLQDWIAAFEADPMPFYLPSLF